MMNKWKSDIQGDSGGICTTLGNDSMSDSKQKSSCEHGSDFERLRKVTIIDNERKKIINQHNT